MFIYIPRLSRGESINGFHKTDIGAVKFVGTTLQAAENECYLEIQSIISHVGTIQKKN